MKLDDKQFLSRINTVARESGAPLPILGERFDASESEDVAAWAGFLEACVRRGIELGDPRWRALSIVRSKPVTTFALGSAQAEPSDDDFRLGLQLLIGMMEGRTD